MPVCTSQNYQLLFKLEVDKILLLELAVGLTAALPRDSWQTNWQTSLLECKTSLPFATHAIPLPEVAAPFPWPQNRTCKPLHHHPPSVAHYESWGAGGCHSLGCAQGDYPMHRVEEGSTNIFGRQDLQTTSVNLPQEARTLAISRLSRFQF